MLSQRVQQNQELNDIIGLVELVDSVDFADSLSRKNGNYGNLTFYGSNDQWLFMAYHTDNTCEECGGMHEETFYGYDLRSFFKWHIIVDENTIYARVHPHCACSLTRLTYVDTSEYEYAVAKVPEHIARSRSNIKEAIANGSIIPKSVLEALKIHEENCQCQSIS